MAVPRCGQVQVLIRCLDMAVPCCWQVQIFITSLGMAVIRCGQVQVFITSSTMAGPVRVSAPIENALGDYAPPQGRV